MFNDYTWYIEKFSYLYISYCWDSANIECEIDGISLFTILQTSFLATKYSPAIVLPVYSSSLFVIFGMLFTFLKLTEYSKHWLAFQNRIYRYICQLIWIWCAFAKNYVLMRISLHTLSRSWQIAKRIFVIKCHKVQEPGKIWI